MLIFESQLSRGAAWHLLNKCSIILRIGEAMTEKVDIFELCRVDLPEGRSGLWKVEKYTFPESEQEDMFYRLEGRAIKPGVYTRLMRLTTRKNETRWLGIMTDTPPEIKDVANVIIQAYDRGGRVLINGLGLGMVLKAILSFPNVTHVDVVEQSPDVIKLVAPTYISDPRVAIHQGNAYTIEWPDDMRWNVVWHDIWDDIEPANLPYMKQLHDKYKDRCDWQDSWARLQCMMGVGKRPDKNPYAL
jgi:hypothetical protein